VCILQILTFCTIISLLNGANGQELQLQTSNGPQPDGTYVFDLPPLQIKPLQIRLMPSQSSLFLIRQNDNSEMEFIPVDQFNPNNKLSIAPEPKDNQNQILSVNTALPKPTPQSLPQVTAEAVPQSSTQAKTQLPRESSVTYDVPTVQSILRELSFYKPHELPPQSLLYQSVPNRQFSTQSNLVPEAPKQNTRFLPSITLPAVTIQSENGPIQTVALELPPQTLPYFPQTFTIPQTLTTLTAQTPAPSVETTPSPTTSAQPLTTDPITAQTIQTQTLSIGVQALPTLEPIAKPKQKVVDIRTFAERSKLSSNLSLKPIAKPIKPTVKPIDKPIVQPRINTSIQKPILTSIKRTPVLSLASPPKQPLQLQTLNRPAFILVQNTAQIEPYKFGYEFTDSLGNQQSRKEEISSKGVVTGNYKYIDANGISRNVQYIADQNG
jgi:hypothetical protein